MSEILKSPPVKSFLDFHEGKRSTHKTYGICIRQYFEYLKKNPDNYIIDISILEPIEKNKVIKSYKAEITNYWKYLKDKNAPKSIRLKLTTVRQFFIYHEIEIPEIFWKKLSKNGNGNSTVTDEKIPTPEILKKILQFATIKSKALFLVASSSGMRIGEIVRITKDDLEFYEDGITKITIRAEIAKNKTRSFTFITPEATHALNSWLKIRDNYTFKNGIDNLKVKQKYESENRDNYIFPFSTQNAGVMWKTLLKKAKLDTIDSTYGRLHYHVHTLRKFFKQNFPDKRVGEALINHSQDLKAIYNEYSEQQLKDIYKKGMPHLLVFEAPPKESDIIQHQQQEIDNLKEDISHLTAILQNLNEKLNI